MMVICTMCDEVAADPKETDIGIMCNDCRKVQTAWFNKCQDAKRLFEKIRSLRRKRFVKCNCTDLEREEPCKHEWQDHFEENAIDEAIKLIEKWEF